MAPPDPHPHYGDTLFEDSPPTGHRDLGPAAWQNLLERLLTHTHKHTHTHKLKMHAHTHTHTLNMLAHTHTQYAHTLNMRSHTHPLSMLAHSICCVLGLGEISLYKVIYYIIINIYIFQRRYGKR